MMGRSNPNWETGLMYFFYLSGWLMLALGAAGRVGALAVLFALGLQQRYAPLLAHEFLLVACVSGLFFVGTGAFSLWTPENRIIERRLGEIAGQEL